MSDDLFLKIISRDIPADIIFENDDVLAFRDINPQAPLHVLIIPKVRIATINDMQQKDAELFGFHISIDSVSFLISFRFFLLCRL